MNLQERDYWLGFNIFPGIGPKRFYHLLKIFGSARKAWYAPKDDLFKTNIPKTIVNNFLIFRETVDLGLEILRVEKCLITFIILEDKNYPINLKKIDFPPPLLFLKGRLIPQDYKALAVVGTRKITNYGREVTERLVSEICMSGMTIVSGLARGVDSLAHRIALGNNGRTIAVLGSGLDNIYPPEHRPLAEKIISLDQGALISELPPGTQPLRGHFPSRNRIISGLSLGVLVTEGALISGSKITCDYAVKYHRPVFAVPGPITSSLSEGPLELIKNGARLVTKAGDILKVLKVGKVDLSRLKVDKCKNMSFKNNREAKIWELLVNGSKHVDELIRASQFQTSEVLSILTTMELTGMVKNIGEGNYIII